MLSTGRDRAYGSIVEDHNRVTSKKFTAHFGAVDGRSETPEPKAAYRLAQADVHLH